MMIRNSENASASSAPRRISLPNDADTVRMSICSASPYCWLIDCSIVCTLAAGISLASIWNEVYVDALVEAAGTRRAQRRAGTGDEAVGEAR